MKTYSFLLNFGYAESGGLGYVPFVSKKEFSSTKAAFIDLANFLKDAYVGEPKEITKACCKKSVTEKLDFCGKCGRSLKEEEFDSEGYIEFVRQLDGANSDSYHGDMVEYDDEARWQSELPDDLSESKIIYVAEKCLAAAIGHSPFNNDKITIDSIFKNHRKSNMFSFWG